MFKNHPKGLPVLFFTELWERFGFYLMLGIFTLYMIDPDGMGFSDFKAADVYGTYLALVYLTPFLGGLLADRVLGYRLSITIGGALMGVGYIMLAIPGDTVFFFSLGLIIIGNGFFKPNISTLVGNLYNDDRFRDYKDSGFNIFYMGINVGAFVCNFVAAYLRNQYGWGYAFAAAGIGMFLGLIWFWAGQKHVKEADVIKPTQPEDTPLPKLLGTIFIPALAAGFIGWIVPTLLFGEPILGSQSTDAFLFASLPIIYFYASLWIKAGEKDKRPIAALLAVMGVVIIFWAIFHQNGSALTIWAERYTDRTMPTVLEGFSDTFNLTQEVDTSPRVVPQLDAHGVPVTGDDGKIVTEIGPDPYFNNLAKENWPEEGKSLKLISTEIFQSINPFFVVVLTPVVVGFFNILRRRKKEPSTPGKIGWGMLITALSTVVMMIAVLASQNGEVKSSAFWLFLTYGVVTIGELCLSPMGLALVSKLSPPRLTALMMGGWFLATAIGNKLSGVLSGLWGGIDNKVFFFMINFVGALIGAALIFMLLKWLKEIIREHTGSH
ncbi:MAG: peptide MFS transporter [Melioribacteraceae bacterium]|nr:peptide MFS transporter [Melioribacteraceae bacterium]MCF8265072.1 peptide MFS transporter [Melioribacteraceae bacterium]MCF8413349.1 peptide MFS transporter [Melioribacteraceae bacterium]MCF8431960.1 peptide MFS transporter [Melioribacteraceae bacterium]